MNISESKITIPKTYFTVTNNFVNNSKALLPNVLYSKIEEFANSIIRKHTNKSYSNAEFYKLEMLKNAFLNDRVNVSGKIKQLNENELQFQVNASSNTSSNIICKALFKFKINENASLVF